MSFLDFWASSSNTLLTKMTLSPRSCASKTTLEWRLQLAMWKTQKPTLLMSTYIEQLTRLLHRSLFLVHCRRGASVRIELLICILWIYPDKISMRKCRNITWLHRGNWSALLASRNLQSSIFSVSRFLGQPQLEDLGKKSGLWRGTYISLIVLLDHSSVVLQPLSGYASGWSYSLPLCLLFAWFCLWASLMEVLIQVSWNLCHYVTLVLYTR